GGGRFRTKRTRRNLTAEAIGYVKGGRWLLPLRKLGCLLIGFSSKRTGDRWPGVSARSRDDGGIMGRRPICPQSYDDKLSKNFWGEFGWRFTSRKQRPPLAQDGLITLLTTG